MKTVFLALLVIGIVNTSWSQNYQLIYPNQEKHFDYTDNSNIANIPTIQSIRIDSIANSGNNVYYYNHQILSQTAYTGSCQITINDSSWIGHQIIAEANGNYLFFNRNADTILIQTLANINDTWVAYTFSNSDYIEATLVSIQYVNLLGIMDSVKTIALQAKDNSNNNINHAFNNKEIKFSKHHGLINFYSMTNFPLDTNAYTLIGSSNPNMGTVNLTAAEIFDYNIGDEFHIENHFRNPSNPSLYDFTNIRRTVLNKVVSNNQDTLTYTIARCQNRYYNPNMIPDTSITSDTITEVIILSQQTHLNQLSNEICSDSTSYSSLLIHPTLNRRTKRKDGLYYRTGASCWSEYLGVFPLYYDYIEGLGGSYYEIPYLFFGENRYELVYYNKNGTSGGTPLNISCSIGTSLSKITTEEDNISVYPNPFSNYTTINISNFLSSEDWQFKLYNVTGNLVHFRKVQSNSFQLERDQLPSGIYFYQIEHNNKAKTYTGKIILE